MASVEENRDYWRGYDWSRGGEEWSETWGGSELQWNGAILPRIAPFLPCESALEIACGHGRWSRHLRPSCGRLILVDLVADAVEACRRRFAGDPGVSCFQNDGRSLPMAPAGSLDFVFSFDSLVHCEFEDLEAYLREIAQKLNADGVGFLHHSNFAAVRARDPDAPNNHWRAESVSAELVVDACGRAGLRCISQEIVNWGDAFGNDCFSIVTRPGSVWARDLVRVENLHFMGEAKSLELRASVLPSGRPGRAPARSDGILRGLGRRIRTLFGGSGP
jgi:SAM-dependent methyltransferase